MPQKTSLLTHPKTKKEPNSCLSLSFVLVFSVEIPGFPGAGSVRWLLALPRIQGNLITSLSVVVWSNIPHSSLGFYQKVVLGSVRKQAKQAGEQHPSVVSASFPALVSARL